MREVVDWNRKWAFSKEAEAVPDHMPQNWNWVNLPHTWNGIDGQDGENDYYRGVCYYAKSVKKEELPRAEEYFLEFQGANSSAKVYWNGGLLAHHHGGYSTWRVSLPDEIKEENLLVVAVDNRQNEEVYPQHADFTFYGGLYRSVRLIAVDRTHFDLEYYGGPGIQVRTQMEGKKAEVEITVWISNGKEGQGLEYEILDAEGKLVANRKREIECYKETLCIEEACLWNGRKNPYLYTARVSLIEKGRLLDQVETKFGCRTFEIDPDKGFILNGVPYPLRGVSRHQDWWEVGNALRKEHHEKDMELICEMGATTIRLAHYQHDSYFYDLCDEKGMVVWAEIPYISSHMPKGRENTIQQMKELIIQNFNHPSIVVWGLSNEITMAGSSNQDLLENHRILNELAHELDPTRKTVIAAVSMCDIKDPYLQIPDVVSYNHYFGWYGGDPSMNGPWFDHFHATFPKLPIGVSEYGCEALDWHTSHPEQGDYTEEYQAYYHEELIKQLFKRPYLWATHVWNMFDFGADARNEGGENGQNHKGLVTFDRKYKKDAFYAYKAWLSDEPFVHLCGKRYVKRMENPTRVTIYSNCPEVELVVNGVSIGKQKSEDHFFYFQVPNEGISHLVAIAGTCKDHSVIEKTDTFYEPYRLKEKGAVLNWFDITAPEGFYSLNDKLEEIMKSEEGRNYLEKVFTLISDNKAEGMAAGFQNRDKMMEMLRGFTLIRMFNLMSGVGAKFSKDELLTINQRLNQIPKEIR